MAKKSRRSNLKPVAGSARGERFAAALDPAYAPIEERSCPDYLAFALDYAKLLNYYGPENKPDGHWAAMFDRDLSFLLARIATTDLPREDFEAWSLQSAVKEGRERTGDILVSIYKAVSRMDQWYRRAREIGRKEGLDNHLMLALETIIGELKRFLGPEFEELLQKLPARAGGTESWLDYWKRRAVTLDDIWKITESDEPKMNLSALFRHPVDILLGVLRTMHLANHKLRDEAARYLEDSLSNNPTHPPHTALYIAFTRLMEQMRGKINTLTGRHLDYYYREMLQLHERPSSPDTAHVCFELAPETPRFRLSKGTRLSAGKDAQGRIIEYATDDDLSINQARVTSLRALYLSRDLFTTAPAMPERVTGISALPHPDSEDGLGAPLKDPAHGWPAFGVSETEGGDPNPAWLHSELGFVAASPVLMLQEGERHVTVTIAFSGDGQLEAALQLYQTAASQVLEKNVAIETLLSDAFLLYVSGEKDWKAVTNASFQRHPVVGTAMEIEFTLKPSDPAVVANAALADAVADGIQWPMFKMVLNPHARVYAYSFFAELDIETIELRVNVQGARQMKLRNELGPVDGAQPFAPFGPLPAQGSYLLLAHRELAVKRIDHVTITMTWFNLPKPPASLESRYAAYGADITDESFKVRIAVQGAEKWSTPSAGHDVFPLFARDFDRGQGVLPTTVLASDMPEIPVPATEQPMPEVLSEAQAPRGTLRIELAEPAMGFGHEAYPHLMAAAATANAQAGKHGPLKPIPNPPLTPITKSLLLDYDASDRLALGRPLASGEPARFYSIYPFGFAAHAGRAPSTFPRFYRQGHLYLGLSELGPRQTLTLMFEIRDAGYSPVPSISGHDDHDTEPIRWRYLAGNEFKDFPEWLLLNDTTMGLTRSGIVKLSMPDDLSEATTIMPGGLKWISAAADRVAGIYWCRVVSVSTQAVTATRVCDPASDLSPPSLPAGSITSLSEQQPQIKAITQPFASRGGRNRESLIEYRTRVSERLRHKSRAIQPFDYERLVLDEFPEVGQVKCIGYNHSLDYPATEPVPPGTLYVVATPRLEDFAGYEPRLPQFMLRCIEDFLRKHVSEFVRDIHVINPVYETLKVFANVEFNVEGDGAYYTDDLSAALSQYLAPWNTKPPKPMPIGSGQVQGYGVSLFLQQQPYVKRLHSMKLLHTYQTEKGYVSRWRSMEQRTWASAPWAVLIPAAHHSITAVGPWQDPLIDPGLRNLTVGKDLVTGNGKSTGQKEESMERRYYLVVPRHAVQRHIQE